MHSGKILLADDDVEDKGIMQDAMEMLNATDILVFANNGAHVLELLEMNSDAALKPCLIVLDLNMPRMNGTQTLSILKNNEQFKHIPVIIYSTSINPLEKEKCLLLGADSYITKPISLKESIETAKIFLQFCSTTTVV
jgi:CheY-like chemotaxis protein